MPDALTPAPVTPEQPRPPELGPLPETRVEQTPPREPRPEQPPVQPAPPPVMPVGPVAAPPTAPLATVQHQVEAVLAGGLEAAYRTMDSATQMKFKREGEVTAGKISLMLQVAKVQVKKIVELIVAWLKIIPGVNVFFLEQEAKIKADKILALRQPPDQR